MCDGPGGLFFNGTPVGWTSKYRRVVIIWEQTGVINLATTITITIAITTIISIIITTTTIVPTMIEQPVRHCTNPHISPLPSALRPLPSIQFLSGDSGRPSPPLSTARRPSPLLRPVTSLQGRSTVVAFVS